MRSLTVNRGTVIVDAMIGILIIAFTCLLVFQASITMRAVSSFDASERQARDLVAARSDSWKLGSTLVTETGTLPSGAAYQLTPATTTSNGVDQLRIEVIWGPDAPLPASSTGWRYRIVGTAVRIQ